MHLCIWYGMDITFSKHFYFTPTHSIFARIGRFECSTKQQICTLRVKIYPTTRIIERITSPSQDDSPYKLGLLSVCANIYEVYRWIFRCWNFYQTWSCINICFPSTMRRRHASDRRISKLRQRTILNGRSSPQRSKY